MCVRTHVLLSQSILLAPAHAISMRKCKGSYAYKYSHAYMNTRRRFSVECYTPMHWRFQSGRRHVICSAKDPYFTCSPTRIRLCPSIWTARPLRSLYTAKGSTPLTPVHVPGGASWAFNSCSCPCAVPYMTYASLCTLLLLFIRTNRHSTCTLM